MRIAALSGDNPYSVLTIEGYFLAVRTPTMIIGVSVTWFRYLRLIAAVENGERAYIIGETKTGETGVELC